MKGSQQKQKSAASRPSGKTVRNQTQSLVGSSSRGHSPGAEIRRGWRGHYRALLRLREHLLKERGEQLRTAATPLEPHSIHLADSATDELDHDLALAELSAEQEALYEVEEAIHRILDGTYGICELTGKPISTQRLRAAPWARFSRETQERLEASGSLRKGATLGSLHPIAKSVEAGLEEAESPEQESPETPAEDETLRVVEQLPGALRAKAPPESGRR